MRMCALPRANVSGDRGAAALLLRSLINRSSRISALLLLPLRAAAGTTST
jgi:hypothetical protein